MRWTEYAVAMLLFQRACPMNRALSDRAHAEMAPIQSAEVPQRRSGIGIRHGGVVHDTNTNWQVLPPASPTMSYLTQMAGLAYPQLCFPPPLVLFLAIVVIRGIARQRNGQARKLLGRYDPVCPSMGAAARVSGWVPLILVSEGVVQNLKPYTTVDLIQPYTAQVTGTDGKTTTQNHHANKVIAQGPVASQEVIKEFGTNGGGFFNRQQRSSFRKPHARQSNFFEMVLIFAIPSGLTYTLGRMTGSQRHGWGDLGGNGVFCFFRQA